MLAGFAVAYAFLLPTALYVKMQERNSLPAHQMRTFR
jgi:hypothetical protein